MLLSKLGRFVSSTSSSVLSTTLLRNRSILPSRPLSTLNKSSSYYSNNNNTTPNPDSNSNQNKPTNDSTSKPKDIYSKVAGYDIYKHVPKTGQAGAGPVSWAGFAITVIVGTTFIYFYQEEKAKQKAEKEARRNRSIGQPKIGGPFQLTDHLGNVRTDKDFLGKWTMIYFGFTFCPDVCPDELEKLTEVLNIVDKTKDIGPVIQPLFISIDPRRDTPEVVKNYLENNDFHPRIIGLCGTTQEIHQVAKAYRVYFSAGLSENPSDDYLVDHTIIQYLMNPEGKLASYFGQNTTAEQAAAKIIDAIRLYNEEQALKEKAKKEEAFEKQKQAYEQAQLSAASASQKQQ